MANPRPFETLALAAILSGVDCIIEGGDPAAWARDFELPAEAGEYLAMEVAKLTPAPGRRRLAEQYGMLVPDLAVRLEKTFSRIRRHLTQIDAPARNALRRFTAEIRTLDQAGTWSPEAVDGLRAALHGGISTVGVTTRPGADGRVTVQWRDAKNVSHAMFWHWPVIAAVLHARVRHRLGKPRPPGSDGMQNTRPISRNDPARAMAPPKLETPA